jgi:hypothetical protein
MFGQTKTVHALDQRVHRGHRYVATAYSQKTIIFDVL